MGIQDFPSSRVETDWICCICHGSAPTNLVSHGGQGDKHPIHRGCVLTWLERSNRCPSCNVEIAFYRILPWIEKFNSPILQAGIGVLFTAAAWKCRLSSLAAIGLVLQSGAVHQALVNEERRTDVAREINALCQDLLHSFSHEKFAHLNAVVATRPKYWRIFSPWVSFEERNMKLFGVKSLLQAVERDLLINQMIRLYRTAAGMLAIFFAAKSLPRMHSEGLVRIALKCFAEWTIHRRL